MHRHGGPGSWFFVPYIFCMTEIPRQILNRLEKQEIRLYPMHLNKEQRHRRKRMVKRAQYSSLHSARGATLPQSGAWNSRPAHTARLIFYYGNGTTLIRGVDPTLAIGKYANILIHNSLLALSPLIHLQRTLGQSMVHCYMVQRGEDTNQYTLATSLRWPHTHTHTRARAHTHTHTCLAAEVHIATVKCENSMSRNLSLNVRCSDVWCEAREQRVKEPEFECKMLKYVVHTRGAQSGVFPIPMSTN